MCDAILRAPPMAHTDKVELAGLAMKVQWEDADAATIASAMAEFCVRNTGGIYCSSIANCKDNNKKPAAKGNVSKGNAKAKAKAKPKIRNLTGKKKDAKVKIAKKDKRPKSVSSQIIKNAGQKKVHKKVPKDNDKKVHMRQPSIRLEKSREQFLCRTGGVGKGSTKTFSFGPGKPYDTEAAARAAAQEWLDGQGINAD